MFLHVIPKSRDGSSPSLPLFDEETAVRHLLAKKDKLSSSIDEAFIEIHLSDFVIYRPDNKYNPYEMEGLQFLQTRNGHSSYLFDGVLRVGNIHRYVEAVPFKLCSIGNYGKEKHDVGSKIWLQSDLNIDSTIYYRLGTPSSDYKPYHDGFTWTANLAKHFVDYLENCEQSVSIYNFYSDFSAWLKIMHSESEYFQTWYKKLGSDDFRRSVVVNVAFLYKESLGVDQELQSQHIWSELLDMNSVPEQLIEENSTIVTPYVYECFRDMRFGHHLKVVKPLVRPQSWKFTNKNSLGLTPNKIFWPRDSRSPYPSPMRIKISQIQVGQVLAVTKDGESSLWKDENGRWKQESGDFWYAYVHTIYYIDGQHEFEALWLYRPSDTCCAKMKYPFPNELFLSDNCTCKSKARIREDEVLGVIPIKWNDQASRSCLDPFVRQTYIQNERFETLKNHHKVCRDCASTKSASPSLDFESQYPIGQPVLVPPPTKTPYDLEVYEVSRYIITDDHKWVLLRRLLRRIEIDGKGKPNELVYTDQVERKLSPYRIKAKCLIRIYTEAEVSSGSLPAPYSRGGAGNAFFISTRLVEAPGASILKPIETDLPKSLLQGYDPLESPRYKVLRGMDLYCGAGNFGRGLEEGGAVRNEYAVDINKQAIHSYSVNLKHDSSTKLYYGSVNDLLSQALRGNPQNSDLIPLPGDIDFISAGSPCQGFSILNRNRNNENGLRNQSMVASVAAYIDFYRPKYGLLENVMTMARIGQGRDEDALSQLISAVVGMGYQLQVFVLDAWSCGNPQSRTRLFVSFVAPGLELLDHPALSHSHPPNVTDRGLGQLANGQPFGRRRHNKTPFAYVSASEATRDLPDIGNGKTYHCTKQPDHILGIGVTQVLRAQIEAIPIFPRGMNFSKAWNEGRGIMSPEQRDLFPKRTRSGQHSENVSPISVAWERVHPEKLFSTIVVHQTPTDARGGSVLHWDFNRPLTVMEARRAQGFPDDEVLLGNPRDAWKLLGNSVARNVAVSLGLSLREAWMKGNLRENPTPPPVVTPTDSPSLAAQSIGESRRFKLLHHKEKRKSITLPRDEGLPWLNNPLTTWPKRCPSRLFSERQCRPVAPNRARRTRPPQQSEDSAQTSEDGPRSACEKPYNRGRSSQKSAEERDRIMKPKELPPMANSDEDELALGQPSDFLFRSQIKWKRTPSHATPQAELNLPGRIDTSMKRNKKRSYHLMEGSMTSSSMVMNKTLRAALPARPTIRGTKSMPFMRESSTEQNEDPITTEHYSSDMVRGPTWLASRIRRSAQTVGAPTIPRRRAVPSVISISSDTTDSEQANSDAADEEIDSSQSW